MAKKKSPKTPSIKKGKYDITVKTDLSPDELLKKAINAPIKKSKVNKKK
jgi:hypothetical protein